jgi:hypothetical protein
MRMASLDRLAIFLCDNKPRTTGMAGRTAVRIRRNEITAFEWAVMGMNQAAGLRSACGSLQTCDLGLQLSDAVLCLKEQLRSIRANAVRHGMS